MGMIGDVKAGLAIGGTAIPITIRFRVAGQQEVQNSFDKLRGSMNLLRGVITQASITTFVFSMLMRRQSQTARTLQTVQENTAETIRKYGRHSLEATQALRRLEQAQENAKFAQIEFALQTLLTIGSLGTLMFRIGDLIAQLGILKGTYLAVAVAKLAALGPIGLLAVGGAFAGGIAIGSIVFGGKSDESNIDGQIDALGNRVRREWDRQRRP